MENNRYTNTLAEVSAKIVDIKEVGVPAGLLKKHIEDGFQLCDGYAVLESKKDTNGFYIGATGMDGMYLATENRYEPVYMNRMDLPLATANRVKGMIEIRDTTRELLEMQLADASDTEIHAQMALLNEQYDKFTAKYGLLNSQGNRRAFNQDASYCLLASLEILNDDGELERKADIFSKRTIKKPEPVTSVDTAVEALSVSMGEKACVDLNYMSELYGKPQEEICNELHGLIFQEPVTKQWQTADEYLSGNVRQKLQTGTMSSLGTS